VVLLITAVCYEGFGVVTLYGDDVVVDGVTHVTVLGVGVGGDGVAEYADVDGDVTDVDGCVYDSAVGVIAANDVVVTGYGVAVVGVVVGAGVDAHDDVVGVTGVGGGVDVDDVVDVDIGVGVVVDVTGDDDDADDVGGSVDVGVDIYGVVVCDVDIGVYVVGVGGVTLCGDGVGVAIVWFLCWW